MEGKGVSLLRKESERVESRIILFCVSLYQYGYSQDFDMVVNLRVYIGDSPGV